MTNPSRSNMSGRSRMHKHLSATDSMTQLQHKQRNMCKLRRGSGPYFSHFSEPFSRQEVSMIGFVHLQARVRQRETGAGLEHRSHDGGDRLARGAHCVCHCSQREIVVVVERAFKCTHSNDRKLRESDLAPDDIICCYSALHSQSLINRTSKSTFVHKLSLQHHLTK